MIVFTATLLTGCDTVRNTLGLDHYQADEFNISENPPLSLPPDYKLRPPKDNAQGSVEVNQQSMATQKARTSLLGQKEDCNVKGSHSSERVLLTEAKAGQNVPSDIRQVVNQEAKVQENKTILDDKLSEIAKNAASLRQDQAQNTEQPSKKDS